MRKLFEAITQRLTGRRDRSPITPSRPLRNRLQRIEQLEERTLLSISPGTAMNFDDAVSRFAAYGQDGTLNGTDVSVGIVATASEAASMQAVIQGATSQSGISTEISVSTTSISTAVGSDPNTVQTNVKNAIDAYAANSNIDFILIGQGIYQQQWYAEGPAASAVEDAVDAGKLVITAAGDDGVSATTGGSIHYQGDYDPHTSVTGFPHDFGGSNATGDDFLVFDVGTGPITAYMQWEGSWTNSSVDIDLVLYGWNTSGYWESLGESGGDQEPTGSSDPTFEEISYNNTGDDYDYMAVQVIRKMTGNPAGTNLEIFVNGTGVKESTFTGAGSTNYTYNHQLFGAAAIEYSGAMTVGTVNSSTLTSPVVADYSSRGPTNTGDTALDGVAVDNINPGSGAVTGTAAAAAFTGGIAALMEEIHPGLTPTQFETAFTATADTLGVSTDIQGNGLWDAREALYYLYTPDLPDLDADSDTGYRNYDNITFDTTPTFTGQVPQNSWVTIYMKAPGAGSFTAVEAFDSSADEDSDPGNYKKTLSTPLTTNGDYEFKVDVTWSESGGATTGTAWNESSVFTMTLDTVDPQIGGVDPIPGTVITPAAAGSTNDFNVIFTEPMAPTTVDKQDVVLTGPAGGTVQDPTNLGHNPALAAMFPDNEVWLFPVSGFVGGGLNAEFTPTVNDIQDLAGNSLVEADGDYDVEADFGDAPDATQSGFSSTYPVTALENGARHNAYGAFMGVARDVEIDGTHSLLADYDDINGSVAGPPGDEDGVTFLGPLTVHASQSRTGFVDVYVDLNGTSTAYVDAWIDFNQDGDWNDPGETLFGPTGQVVTATGIQNLSFTIPANALAGQTFSRFRVSSLGGLAPTGGFQDGEVEDHIVEFLPEITIDDVTRQEGADGGATTAFTFTVTRSQINTAVDVDWVTTDGTATTGDADYAGGGGTLNFLATVPTGGVDTQTITVFVNEDSKVEADETFTVDLTPNVGSLFPMDIQDPSGLGTIVNDDSATLTVGDVTQNEDAGVMTFTVTLDNAVQGGLTVDYATSDGTALTGDSDYTAAAGTLTFSGTAGETQTFTVPITADTKVEANETFTVTLSNAAALGTGVPGGTGTITGTDTATGTIVNDDSATLTVGDVTQNEDAGVMTFTVTLDNAVQGGLTVDYATSDGTALTGDSDYTAAAGTLTFSGTAGETQTFTVPITADTKVEANETFTVTLSNAAALGTGVPGGTGTITGTDTATGTIVNDDSATLTVGDVTQNEDAGVMTFTVTLDNAVQGGLTVDYATSDGTALTGDSDYTAAAGTLTFSGTAGETQTFTVPITADTKVEANETFTVTLSNAAALGTGVPGGTGTITGTDTATGTIVNDDSATLTVGDVTQNEDAGVMTFTVTLDNAVQGGLTVDYATSDGTALTGDSDYTAAAGTLTFSGTAGETQTFTVPITADTKVEANETFTVTLSNAAALGTGVPGGTGTITGTDTATGTIVNDDSATLTVGDVTQNEDAGVMTFTVTLDNAVQGGLTVDYATSDGTALTGDSDYTAAAGTLTFSGTAGETQTFTVPITADTKVEANETFTVTLSNAAALGTGVPGGTGTITGTDTATGTIVNDDSATLTVGDVTQNEDAGVMTFTVTLDNAVQGGLTVDYATSDGTALTGDSDYTAAAGTLTFSGTAGETQTFTVPITADTKVEANETFTVTLSNAAALGTGVPGGTGTITGTDTATGTIVNDDSATLTVGDVTQNEDAGVMTFTVTLDNAVQGGLTVDYATSDGTALTGDSDYTAAAGTLTFSGTAGETQTFTVPITADTKVEANETFTVTLSNAAALGTGVPGGTGTITGTDTATGTIVNDDSATLTVGDVTQNEDAGVMTFTVTLDNAVQGGLTVDYATSDGTALTGDSDYTAAAGTLTFSGTAGETQTFTVPITADTKVEANETFTVTLSNAAALGTGVPGGTGTITGTDTATGTIVNDDSATLTVGDVTQNEDAGVMTFTVTLDNAVQGGLTVDYATSDGTALTGDSDYTAAAGTLTFSGTAGETQTFTVPITADTKVEANETFTVTLSNAAALGTGVPGGTGTITGTDTATGTIVNDDSATLTVGDVTQNEDAGVMTFTVTLDNAVQGGLTVDYATSDGTALTGDSDYTAAAGTLTFSGTAGETQTFTVPITADTKVEANETFTVTLSNAAALGTGVPGGTGTITGTDTATGTIVNDDSATLTVGDVTQNEDAGVMTFTVTLDNAVQGGLTVDYATSDGTALTGDSDYTAAAGTLTFSGTAGETQTFTVPITADTKVEANETFTVTLSNAAALGTGVPGGTGTITGTDTATGTIVNDDSATLTVGDVTQNEDAGVMTFTVTLDNAVQGGLTVDYATSDGTALTGDSDYTAAAGTLTFSGTAGETQTFTVPITADTKVEANETFTVTLSNAAALGTGVPGGTGTITGTDTATGTIVNDDSATLTVGDVTQNEDAGVMTFTVTLDNAVQGGLTVDYATSDGTALTGDSDYTAAAGTLTFSGTAGETQTFTVPITADTKVEANETFTVTLSNAAALGTGVPGGTGTITGTDTATGTIVNDDSATLTVGDVTQNEDAGVMTFTVTLDNAVQGGLTVDYATSDGTALTGDSDYTAAAGTLTFSGTAGETQTFTVPITADTKVEANETFTVTLSNAAALGTGVPGGTGTITGTDTATGTIVNDDSATLTVGDVTQNEDAGVMTFTVTLDNAVQGGLTVDYATSDGTALTGDSDYTAAAGTLTFSGTAGETQTFTVPITADTKVEANETFTVTLSNAAALGTGVPGGTGTITGTDTATGTIVNDDSATLTVGDVTQNEDAGVMTFTVTLDNAVQGGLTVDYATSDGTALTGDSDYTAAAGTLTFSGTAGETQTFTVPITADTKVEANETFTVTLSNAAALGTGVPGGTGTITGTDTATGTIVNDDSATTSYDDIVGRASASGDWFVAKSDGSGFTNEHWGKWTTAVSWTDIQVGDFNGDGKADVLGRAPASGDWFVARSTGTGFVTEPWGKWTTAVNWTDIQVGDFNGDGMDDLAGRSTTSGDWFVSRSTGSAFAFEPWGKWTTAVTWVDVQVGDFNGDGYDDIAGRSQGSGDWFVAKSTSTAFAFEHWGKWTTAVTWVDIKVGDFSGDGKDDIVGRSSTSGDWFAARSTGSAFAFEHWGKWTTAVTWSNIQVGDFNGDGRDDLVGRSAASGDWFVSRSTGSTFIFEPWGKWTTAVTWDNVMVGDFTGDGNDDLVGHSSTSGDWFVSPSTGSGFGFEHWGKWTTAVTWVDVQVGDFDGTASGSGVGAAAADQFWSDVGGEDEDADSLVVENLVVDLLKMEE